MANFVTGSVTPYFGGRKVSRVTFRVTGAFSENCHGLVKKCHGKKKQWEAEHLTDKVKKRFAREEGDGAQHFQIPLIGGGF